MSNEVSELKEHVRWLEGELGSVGHIEDQLDEIKAEVSDVHERLDKVCDLLEHMRRLDNICDVLESMRSVINNQNDVINNHSDKLKELIAAFNGLIRNINAAKQSQPAPSPFTKPLNDRPKYPKRQPKVADKDRPEKPGAS